MLLSLSSGGFVILRICVKVTVILKEGFPSLKK